MIYLDNNATTEIVAGASGVMRFLMETNYGNPSSAHALGRATRDIIEDGRQSVADLIGAASESEIIFTSGGTESDNWAIQGGLRSDPSKNHIVTTRVEHEAVRKTCETLEKAGHRVTWLDVDGSGGIDLEQLKSVLSPETAIVSVMYANNETGVLFPVAEAAEIVKANSDALFHTDAVNAAGKVAIDLKRTAIDLLSISAHKFHGPKGIGALYVRNGTHFSPIMDGGGQEGGMRPGTEPVHQIAGMGAAAEFVRDMAPMARVRELRNRLEESILDSIPNAILNGTVAETRRLPNTSNISFVDTNGEAILARLDEDGIYVSTGSACNSESHRSSPVLEAMNIPFSHAMGSIRFSLGRLNTEEEIDTVLEKLPEIVSSLRAMAA
jgi:cysteine desulfurase